ncbi:sulfatase [Haloferax sp. Atlit-4N]|uniref:sulfatase-like hydrolase/transferase n=1 Tax=Haloferax sp. Atlit-4N TaxID=2077206 RepID=UPI000E25D0ED|nr:sulfatase-like hydrolase/transferase [Haloferax sp. Atlit-4N]RDZ51354.1 sulfatase [Haloferax sp. Atlit-4N]
MDETNYPNIVWISMEDTTPRFGCYGDNTARTPNIDDMAADGRRYDNAFCTAGVCAPSRASVMTGLYPPTIGAHHMRTRTHDYEGLPDSYEAVPPHYVTAVSEYLRDAGYYCTLDSKTDYQFGEPFTMWDRHGEGAGWWDDDRGDDQPFFAMFTNNVTHESGMWDPEMRDMHGGGVADPVDTDPNTVDVPPYLPDTDRTRRAIARQYDNIATSDAWVGDLIDRLEADGLAENTAVVLWSDHGEGLPRKKRWPYDSGTHVPLIVRWPGQIEGGDATDDLVSLVDLGPTTLSIAGVDVPQYVQGRPFLGPDADDECREYVFATRDRYDEEYDMMRSVRDERYRYVRNYYPERPYVQWIPYRNRHPAMEELLERDAAGELTDIQHQWFADTRPAEELYDLQEDPHETENLADDLEYRGVLERLRGALDDWRERIGDRAAAREGEWEMRERIWPDGDQPKTATPTFVPNAPGNRGLEPTNDGGTFEGPMAIKLFCPTQGASIAYTTGDSEDPRWKLYSGPIHLEPGETVLLRTKAVRYGYAESNERQAVFQVE